MTAQKTTARRERSIPVRVTVDPRPAPTSLPPVNEIELRPTIKQEKKSVKEKITNVAPIRAATKPVDEWSEEKRRRLMWGMVVGGMAVVVIGWLAVVKLEMNGGSGQNIFAEAVRLLKTVHITGTNTNTANTNAQQEIQQLNQQVFPQFNK